MQQTGAKSDIKHASQAHQPPVRQNEEPLIVRFARKIGISNLQKRRNQLNVRRR